MDDVDNKKVKRTSYSATFKKKVIAFADAHGNRAAGREFVVDEKNVRRWKSQRMQLSKCIGPKKCFRGPKTGRYPELEAEVVNFVKERRDRQLVVTSEIIQLKALDIARQRNIPRREFKAARGWVERFMQRNGFSLRRRTSISQKLPADFEEKLVNFQKYVIGLRRAKDYLLGQIGNTDQTPVFFDMPSNYTINEKGAKEVRLRTTGGEKMRMTVMLAITADGRKLPPYIIFKRKTIPKGERFPKGAVIRAQEKGWMTNELMVDWIRCVWLRRPGALLNLPNMLVLDAFRGHLTEEVKSILKRNKTDQVVIPGGMTSQLQPLDVSINKPFKDNLRRHYDAWLSRDDLAITPAGNIKRASLSQVTSWVLAAWEEIPEAMVAKSFKKCCISNALDGSEDDLLWDTDEEDVDYVDDSDSDSDLSDCGSEIDGQVEEVDGSDDE